MVAVCESVKWNWPGKTSVTLPSNVQLLRGKLKFVAVKALKLAFGVFEKDVKKIPLVNVAVLKVIGKGTTTFSTANELVTLPKALVMTTA